MERACAAIPNIQGLTDVGLLGTSCRVSPCRRTAEPTLEDYMKTRQFRPLRPKQVSYYQNTRKFFVSLMKAIYMPRATFDNNWAYDWLPKLDVLRNDIIRAFEIAMVDKGEMGGYICQGFNPCSRFRTRARSAAPWASCCSSS